MSIISMLNGLTFDCADEQPNRDRRVCNPYVCIDYGSFAFVCEYLVPTARLLHVEDAVIL
jgi:hypothetical protein